MSTSLESDTKKIGFLSVFFLLLLGPIVAVVYSLYSAGYWMEGKGWRVVVYPYAVFFAIVNTLHNWTVCTILFRELPREFFTTKRVKRWKTSEDNSRRELADLIGGFLNGQDAGHY